MKLAVSVGQRKDGKWEVIQLPDIHIRAQKQFLKTIRTSGGKVGKVEYSMVALALVRRKYRFDASGKVIVPRVVDSLTELNAEGLQKVIAANKLSIKVGDDHEAVREAIRKAIKKA